MKANLVQRNLNTVDLQLGDYGFKPYEELVVNDREEELIQYNEKCDDLAKKLTKKFEMIRSVGNLAKIISKKSEIAIDNKDKDIYLLPFLADLENLEQYDQKLIEELDSYKQLNDDILIRTIYDKWLIDTQIITVYDNKKALELKTLEVCDSYDLVHPSVFQSLDPQDYNVKLNYSVLKRSIFKTSDETKSLEWPHRESTIPSEFKEYELIIYKNDAKEDINIKEFFQSVWNKLKINGFLQV